MEASGDIEGRLLHLWRRESEEGRDGDATPAVPEDRARVGGGSTISLRLTVEIDLLGAHLHVPMHEVDERSDCLPLGFCTQIVEENVGVVLILHMLSQLIFVAQDEVSAETCARAVNAI